MKKKLCTLLALLLIFALCCGIPAFAEGETTTEETAPTEETATGEETQQDETPAEEAENIAQDTAQESAGPRYVFDEAGILSDDGREKLDARAAQLTDDLKVAVYIAVLRDYTNYNRYSVERCAEELYTAGNFGYGEGKDGILLLLSMEDRDYSLTTYGEHSDFCFGDRNKNYVEAAFLDNFRNNDWQGGFEDYLNLCEDILTTASENGLNKDSEACHIRSQNYSGNSYYYGELKEIAEWQAEQQQAAVEQQRKKSQTIKTLIVIVVPCLVALIVCSTFKAQMKTASERSTAEEYVVPGSAILRTREDRFTHRTETRTRISSDSSSSGGSRGGGSSGGGSSGGFHSHSGKF